MLKAVILNLKNTCGYIDPKDVKVQKYFMIFKELGPVHAQEIFLKGFSGFLQTDEYNGYNKVENVKKFYCLAHIRRKFYEVIANLDDETLKKSRAIIGLIIVKNFML